MVGAMEKSKLVYILNRDAAANLTISSPLEAHKANAIIHHLIGVDVGFENPLYAALEVDYSESDNDPSGEAFRKTEKVSATLQFIFSFINQISLDVDLLRAGSWSKPCRS